ncbi:MAG TPA: TonB-dependent receptor, partial [Pseudomonadales bacterium]
VYETLLGEDTAAGGYALAHVSREAEASGWAVQSYYQRAVRDRLGGLRLDRSIADLDAHWHRDWSRQKLLVGAGYRYSTDDTEPGRDFTLSPASRTTHLVSGFAQWTGTLQPELHLMLGSKVTWDTFTEWEPHPSARLWWTPTQTQTAWVAISRPVRTPTRVDRDGMFIFGIVDSAGVFVPTGLRGSESVDSEWLLAYEAGYRIQPRSNLSLDAALYFNDYHDLISIPSVPGTFNNAGEGESYGVELAATVRPYDIWDVTAGYAFTEVEHSGPIITFEDRNAPKHIAYARSAVDLAKAWEFDTVVYYVDDIPLSQVPSYTRLDCGLNWRVRSGFEAAVWGHNLLRPGIRELGADFPRGVWAEGKLRF